MSHNVDAAYVVWVGVLSCGRYDPFITYLRSYQVIGFSPCRYCSERCDRWDNLEFACSMYGNVGIHGIGEVPYPNVVILVCL